jgi:hypothetical protein
VRRGRTRGAVTLGAATFLAVLGLGLMATPTEEVEAEQPAVPAGALTHVAKMNADANQVAAQRIRREAPSAL